jgi:hypothetical protein
MAKSDFWATQQTRDLDICVFGLLLINAIDKGKLVFIIVLIFRTSKRRKLD